MPDVVAALLGSSGEPIKHPSVISGYISKLRPAPTAFSDPVYLIAPNHSEDRPYGPCAWPAIHGSTKPVKGDPVVFVMDDNNTPHVVSWGSTSTADTIGDATTLNVCDPEFGAKGDSSDSTAAFKRLRDKIIATRIADVDAGAGFHRCTAAGYVPPGRYVITDPGALMDATGDPAGDGTFGYELFGLGEATEIVFTPPTPGALFRNINQFIFPRIRDLKLIGGGPNAIGAYSASDGLAQGWTWQNIVWWGTWAAFDQVDALTTAIGSATITIASPAVITCTAHGLSAGAPVSFATTGTLPTGLTAGTTYFVVAAGLTANTLQVSAALGGTAINTSGSQSGVHTLNMIQANGNDTHRFPGCRGRAALTKPDGSNGACFELGLTAGVTNQDEAITHQFSGANMEITNGDVIRANYGGHFTIEGGSFILIGGTDNRLFNLPAVPSHSLGTLNLTVKGTRAEIRSATGKIIDSRWGFGTISFEDFSNDGYATPSSQVVATFDGSGNCGPLVKWERCQLKGRHEYVYNVNGWQGGPAKARYDACQIDSYADPRDMILHTDGDSAGAVGNCWRVGFDDLCRGADTFASRLTGRDFSTVSNWKRQLGAIVGSYFYSVKTAFGVLPQNGASITVFLPIESTLIAVHNVMPAKGGGSGAVGWTITVSNSDGTIHAFSPGTAWNLGYEEHATVPWRVLDTDGRRQVTVTVTGVNDSQVSQLCLLELLPGN